MQSSPDIDPRLDNLLAPIVGPGRQDPDGTIELTVIVDGVDLHHVAAWSIGRLKYGEQ